MVHEVLDFFTKIKFTINSGHYKFQYSDITGIY